MWGKSAPARCAEIILSLFVKGHLVDIQLAAVIRIIRVMARMLQRYPQYEQTLVNIIQARNPQALEGGFISHRLQVKRVAVPFGPGVQFLWALGQLGWRFVGNVKTLRRLTTGETFDLFTKDIKWLCHIMREDLRHMMRIDATLRRDDMRGLDTRDLDRKGTLAIHGRLKGPPKRTMATILTGAVQTCCRLHRQKKLASNLCPHCDLRVPESQYHMFHDCPAWEPERSQAGFDHSAVAQLPDCTKNCGLGLISPILIEWEESRESKPEPWLPQAQHRPDLEHPDARGLTQIWTDGSSIPAAQKSIHSGGCGAFWGEGHPNNFGISLPGKSQTSDRAELYAILRVLEMEQSRPVMLICDNKYVVDMLNHVWQGGEAKCAHQDLWGRICTLLTCRTHEVRVKKTTGHTIQRHIQMGLSTEIDRLHNEKADQLAETGALQNVPPPAVIADVLSRRALVSKIQKMRLGELCKN